MAEKIKTVFQDAVVKNPSPKPSGGAEVNGEPGFPKRTSTPNGVDEVVRCSIK